MSGVQLKVCGVVSELELAVLDELAVDFAGLWFHIPNASHELDRRRFFELCAAQCSHVRCVGVTTESDPEVVVAFVRGARLAAVQLQGFALPGALRQLRRSLAADVELFKVLHVREGVCLEATLLEAYVGSGADAFVIDCFASRLEIGSTGQRVSMHALAPILERLGSERVFVAGGVNAENMNEIVSRFAIRGVDVDSAARSAGRLDRVRVQALARAAATAQPKQRQA
jgi:phosphoribosylanthranilate isomerase